MPHSKGKSFKYYDGAGKEYIFYARDEATALRNAVAWTHRMGFKLYRKKGGVK
jgi:hypothetical protein